MFDVGELVGNYKNNYNFFFIEKILVDVFGWDIEI